MRDRYLLVAVLALIFSACGGGPTANSVSSEASPPAAAPQPSVQSSPLNDFEEALRFVRNGQFTYIWVFSRKDGKPFDAEDGALLRTKARQVVDWAKTDDLKKFVAGSNYPFEDADLVELQKRFVIEDYSAR